jgi:hypothetical protein
MKSSFLKLLFVFSIVFFVSCSKNNDSTTPETTANQTISADIDGVSWTSIQGGAVANITSITSGFETKSVIQIIGVKLDQSSMSIQMPLNTISQGTHNFGTNDSGILSYNFTNTAYASGFGNGNFSINVTNYNLAEGLLSGTFSGKLYSTDGTTFKTITNGIMTNIKVSNSSLYSNGSMSLKLNGGSLFSLDNNNADGKYLLISQSSINNSLLIIGYNLTLGNDFGVSSITLPINATVGSHNLSGSSNYSASFSNTNVGNSSSATSGAIVVVSNTNKNIVGTFSYSVINGTQTNAITSGSFNITYQ